jgi:hypothetical protein
MFRGPGINSSDLSLLKNFSLGAESRTLQFRLEIYNTFNHTQFATLENVARFDAARRTGQHAIRPISHYAGWSPGSIWREV